MKYLKVYFLDGQKPTLIMDVRESKKYIKGFKCNLHGMKIDDELQLISHSIIRKTLIYKLNKYQILKQF